MEILSQLFGSSERVRIMRYVLAHEKESFDYKTVAATLDLDVVAVRRELKLLTKATFLKECSYTKHIEKKKGKTIVTEKEKVSGYKLNASFVFLVNFKNLLLEKEELAPTEIFEHFRKLGKIELFVVSGVFQGKTGQELDICIVGTSLKKSKIEDKISELEGFIGVELKYALFDTEEFMYRYMLFDRFVRNIVDGDNILVVNQLPVKSKR
jgi:hypothetical protein